MSRLLRALPIVLSLLAVSPALGLAQDPTPRRASTREGRQIDGRTVYEWTDADAVEGSGSTPYGDIIQRRGRLPRRSLIRIRENFVPEALKSVERL